MPEIVQRVKKVGGSLMVRLPKDFVDLYKVKEGDLVSFNPKRETTEYCGALSGPGWTKPNDNFYSKHL